MAWGVIVDSQALYLAIGAEEEAAAKAGKKPQPPNNNHIFFNLLATNTVRGAFPFHKTPTVFPLMLRKVSTHSIGLV